MPRLHSPGLEGGEDGDGLPENFHLPGAEYFSREGLPEVPAAGGGE